MRGSHRSRAFLIEMRKFAILSSWLLVAAGSYLVFNGALEKYSTHKAQTAAANSWKEEASYGNSDEPVLPAKSSGRRDDPRIEAKQRPAEPFESLAKLTIPRLKAELYVVEGTDQRSLRRGPGHMPGTELPGGPGNCIIAGHRDTHFRVLQNIRNGDEIVLESHGNAYKYRVSDLSVIAPTDTQCLDPTKKPVLNLITCYPFHYVGPAPKRFIVHADLETGNLWGGHFWPQPPFRRRDPLENGSAGRIARPTSDISPPLRILAAPSGFFGFLGT